MTILHFFKQLPGQLRRWRPEPPPLLLAGSDAHGPRGGGGGSTRAPRDRSLFEDRPAPETPSGPARDAPILHSFRTLWDRVEDESQVDPRPVAGEAREPIEGIQAEGDTRPATDAHLIVLTGRLGRSSKDLFPRTHGWLDPATPPRTRKGEVVRGPEDRDARQALQVELDSTRELASNADVRDWTAALGLELSVEQAAVLRPAWDAYLRKVDELLVRLQKRAGDKKPLDIQGLQLALTEDNGRFRVAVGEALRRGAAG